MPFVKGQSGNPAGRPLGSRNKVNLEAEAAFEAAGGGLVDRIIDHAAAGHATAMRLCMDRMLPMGRHRPVAIMLPAVDTPDYARAAAAEICRALAAGDISIDKAKALIGVAAGAARLVAPKTRPATDLAERLERCEEALTRCLIMLGAGETIDNNNAETMAPERVAAAPVAPADGPVLVDIRENTSAAGDAPAAERSPTAAGTTAGRRGINGGARERLMGSTSPLAHLTGAVGQKNVPTARAPGMPAEIRAA
jgi:uncharacterized protein DUF5681